MIFSSALLDSRQPQPFFCYRSTYLEEFTFAAKLLANTMQLRGLVHGQTINLTPIIFANAATWRTTHVSKTQALKFPIPIRQVC
jgi:hypothetical protein